MNDTWDLPLILNQTLKDKVNSVSLYQPMIRVSSPSKPIKHQKKDLYACLRLQPRYQPLRSKTKNNSHLNSLETSPKKNNKVYLPKNKTRKVNSMTQDQPGTLLLSAFLELQRFLKNYFETNCVEETLQQRYQLRQAVEKGSTLTLLRKSLTKLRELDKILIDIGVNILFHSLLAQVQLSISPQEAIYHLKRTQFYALKSGLFKFASYCLCEQAIICRERGSLEQSLFCLKKALVLTIHSKEKQLINSMLQKIGIYFYYSGNTHIGTYYHRLAERDLTYQEEEIFKRELNIPKYQEKMESQLFGVKKKTKKIQQKEKDESYEEQCSKIQKEERERQNHQQTMMISKMLKDCKLRKVGNRLKGHMGNTNSLASIVTYSHSPTLPQSTSENLPIINVSHVLKSHLSKNRGVSPTSREWQYGKIISLIGLIPA